MQISPDIESDDAKVLCFYVAQHISVKIVQVY